MPQVYDLHAHTTASDGSLTPSELVAFAKQNAIDVLAVTDHDVTAGLEEAITAADDSGMQVIPGIEISVSWAHQTIHVVGLHIDPVNTVLQSGLNKLKDFRVHRAHEIARRLGKAGIGGAFEGASRFARGEIIGRTHFARFLVDAGHSPNMKHVFKHYLVRNKPGYVPGEWAQLDEAVNWIRAAGGLAVIAHPARYKLSASRLQQLLATFRDCGGVAIEVVSGSHTTNDILRFSNLADSFGLYSSRGSDYHGPETSYIDPARLPALPEICRPVWTHTDWHAAMR